MADWENLDSELDVKKRKAVLKLTMAKPEHRGFYSCSLLLPRPGSTHSYQSLDGPLSFLHVQSKGLASLHGFLAGVIVAHSLNFGG